MSSSARVLTGLVERRALEAAFVELAETSNLDQLVARAQTIAQQGSAVVPVLLSMLDTDDPQLRGGLGQVASQIDRAAIVPALRGVARARDRSDQARLTALMILDRFLHEPVDDSLLAGLQDPEMVALQSLRELVHEMESNQFVVIEYLSQLSEQPADVAQTVLDVVPRLPSSPHLITLLRMFAQGDDKDLAQGAIEQLGRDRSVEAAQALVSLTVALPPERAALAERALRKLRMRGIPAPTLNPAREKDAWRALLSPIDGTGAQVVWFVSKPDSSGKAALFSVLCKDPEGIVASFGSLELTGEDVPAAQPLGSKLAVQQASDTPPITFIEVPLDAGRLVVQEASALSWRAGHAPPMEYRLLNPLIWDLGPLDSIVTCEAMVSTPAQAAALLDHPAFVTWSWQGPEIYDVAEGLGRRHSVLARKAQIDGVARRYFTSDVAESYRRRLLGMARWLTLADHSEAARLAKAAAEHFTRIEPVELPFVRRLIGIGLDVAIANLRSGFDLRRHAVTIS